MFEVHQNQSGLASHGRVRLFAGYSFIGGNTTNEGRLTILSSSYAGSPRHVHEYAHDAIAHVHAIWASRTIHYIHVQSSFGRYTAAFTLLAIADG